MTAFVARGLLALSASLLAIGGYIHAAAFHKVSAIAAASNLPAFFRGSVDMLWLADSATMFALAAVFALIAARPVTAGKPVVLLLALIPAGNAVLVYMYLGAFFAGHLMLAIAGCAFVGGAMLPANNRPQGENA
jgi:hypothetical protein